MRVIIAFFLFINMAQSKDFQSTLDTLLNTCNVDEYGKNFKIFEKEFYREKGKFNDKTLISMSRKEKENNTYLIWDTLRVFFPYEIPEDSALKSVFMRCYLDKKKFDENMTIKNFKFWRGCLNYTYKGKIPKFEKKVLECNKKMIK